MKLRDDAYVKVCKDKDINYKDWLEYMSNQS